MKVSLLLETIITSGLSMVARDHGGAITSQSKLDAILNQASYVDTGITQMFTTADVKDLIRKAIENRNLSAIIDIIKEVAQNWPGELLQYSKDIKQMLKDAGYTDEPLYLAREPDLIKPGHVEQHLARGQVIYRLRQTYVLISNQQLNGEERLRAVDVFISILICNPHLQREVVRLCLTDGVVANHLDPELPHVRLFRLRDILIKMATDALYKFPEEPAKVHVPELKLVEDEPEQESQYAAKPEPWLHFTGTDHLTAQKQEHGALQQQIATFTSLVNTKEGTPGSRLRDAVAYIHRSDYQPSLAATLIGAAGVDTLDKLNDNRMRADEVRKILMARVTDQSIQQSVYSHPSRKPFTSAPLSNVDIASLEQAKINAQGSGVNRSEEHSIPMDKALEDILAQFGNKVKVVPLDISMFKASPQDAIKSIMAQLGYMKPEQRLAVDECKARVQTALPELFNKDGTLDILAVANRNTPKAEPAPIQISGGDAQMRADIETLFAGRGRKVVFTDQLEVPKLTLNEVHTYQCQVGGAIVALQYRAIDHLCTLTAVADNRNGKQMQPLHWQAPESHIPEIWANIREALNHHDAYHRIERFLDESGYTQ